MFAIHSNDFRTSITPRPKSMRQTKEKRVHLKKSHIIKLKNINYLAHELFVSRLPILLNHIEFLIGDINLSVKNCPYTLCDKNILGC